MKRIFKKILEINNNINMYLYKKVKLNRRRIFLFNYLEQGLKNGSSFKGLLDSIAISLYKTDIYMYNIILDVLDSMEKMGHTDTESLYKAGLINKTELNAISGISESEPYKAYEFIINKNKNESNLKWGVGMLVAPVLIVLIGFIIFQPELKSFTKELLEPINNISTKEIEIPAYFESRDVFVYWLAFTCFIIGSFALLINLLKKYKINYLFKFFKIYEREFILNNISIFLSLIKSGYSPIKAINILADEEGEIVTRVIFKDIKYNQENGLLSINEVLSKYNIDEATVAYIRSGEDNNDLEKALSIVLDYNKLKYENLTKILVKVLPLIGEIIMTIALLKPLIDIINVTTIGTMAFEV